MAMDVAIIPRYLNDIHSSNLIVELVERAYDDLDSRSLQEQRELLDAYRFRQEFGMVKIRMARRTGHTTAALQLLSNHSSSLILVKDFKEKDRMRDNVCEFVVGYRERDELLSRIIIGSNAGDMQRLAPEQGRSIVMLERAETFTFLEKEGAVAFFSRTTLIVELQ